MIDEIRPRRPEDLGALIEVLAEQQSPFGYPFTWPLPFPARNFIERPGHLMAWTALREGRPVGHVGVERPSADADESDATNTPPSLTNLWVRAHQRHASELAVVSALFTATSVRGSGLGGRLLSTAVQWIQDNDLAACLDIVPGPGPAMAMYKARGWHVAGETRPSWLPETLQPLVAMVLPSDRQAPTL